MWKAIGTTHIGNVTVLQNILPPLHFHLNQAAIPRKGKIHQKLLEVKGLWGSACITCNKSSPEWHLPLKFCAGRNLNSRKVFLYLNLKEILKSPFAIWKDKLFFWESSWRLWSTLVPDENTSGLNSSGCAVFRPKKSGGKVMEKGSFASFVKFFV